MLARLKSNANIYRSRRGKREEKTRFAKLPILVVVTVTRKVTSIPRNFYAFVNCSWSLIFSRRSRLYARLTSFELCAAANETFNSRRSRAGRALQRSKTPNAAASCPSHSLPTDKNRDLKKTQRKPPPPQYGL